MSQSPFRPALMVVDMQEDFCEPNGSLAIKGGRELAPVINELLKFKGFALKVASRDFHPRDHISFASQHAGAEAFKTQHTIPNPENEVETQTILLWPDHCVQGTSGCEIIPELHIDRLDKIIDKGMDKRVESYSAFGPPFRNPAVSQTGLEKFLRDAGITHVFCVGLAYNFCVKSTAADAAEVGFETFIVEEGTRAATTSPEIEAAVRKELAEKGVKVIKMDSEEVRMVRGL